MSAAFYPFFSIGPETNSCRWAFGSYIPGWTESDFGGNVQYGQPLALDYLQVGGHGAIFQRINAFRQILPRDPCSA